MDKQIWAPARELPVPSRRQLVAVTSHLWDVKPAIEPAVVSPSTGNNGLPISQHIPLCHLDTEPMHEANVRGVTDTAAVMEASSGDGSQNDFGSEAKKQRS